MMMLMLLTGHECTWGTVQGWENQWEGEGEEERTLKDEEGEVQYIYTYEDSVTKPTEHCLKRGRREGK
jgi:hypothetical protein